MTALLFAPAAHAEKHHLPLFVSETSAGQEGVLRVINLSDEASTIVLHAIDDAGARSTPATLTIGPRRALELDAGDLALGNASKNLAGGLGPLDGDRRLELDTDLPVQFLAYLRAPDGSLTLLHDRVRRRPAPGGGFEHRVEAFNPARDMAQQSRLRLVNAGALPAAVSIAAHDDAGGAAVGGGIGLTLSAGVALSLTAQQLEAGDSRVSGQFGAGTGAWRLLVTSDQPIEVVNLARAATGELVNLSTAGIRGPAPEDHGAFGDRFADVMIESRSQGQARFFHLQAEDRFTETTDAAGSDARGGDYTYERAAANAGRVSQTFDDGEQCVVNLHFTSATGGWFASRCASGENGDADWTGGTWSVAEIGEPPPAGSSPGFRSADTPADQTYPVGSPIAALTLPAATGGDGTLTYTLTPAVPGLAFDPATRRLTGTPTATGTHAMTYTVIDGDGDTATLMFTITVRAAGGGTGGGGLGDCRVGMIVRPGESCTYPGTDNAFSVGEDGRGSFLVITSSRAINVNNANFQGRLYDFRASHQGDGAWRVDRLEGSSTPPSGGGGDTDTSPAFAQGSAPPNQIYRVGAPIATLTLPAGTGGDGQLTYSLTPQIPGLEFDPATRQLAGTPTRVGTHAMTYSVTDADGDADSLEFTITVESGAEDPDVPKETDLLRASGCGDGSYVEDPDNNAALVSDCRALAAFANAIAAQGELPDDHVFHQWGRESQTKLQSWMGIRVGGGRITSITLRVSGIKGSIPSELGRLTALTYVTLTNGEIDDISTLTELTELEILQLHENKVEDISPLAALTNLTTLRLFQNQVSDLTPLTGLTNLLTLGLAVNRFEDLSPLSAMTNLKSLDLLNNQISDISALSRLTNLTYLRLSRNPVSDLTPLAGMTKLTVLGLSRSGVQDISSLSGMEYLQWLDLRDNQVSDLSPLAGLTMLETLALSRNEVQDISSLTGLTNLEWLNLSDNGISDLTPLVGLTELTTLRLGRNNIVDISPLVSNQGLGDGVEIDLRDNPLSDESIDVHAATLKGRGAVVLHPLKLIDEFPDSRLVQVYNDNVVVMEVEEDVGSFDMLESLEFFTNDLYHWFEDEFDYLMFLSNGAFGEFTDFGWAGVYYSVMNDTEGTGKGEFLDSRYGSEGRLRGIIHFPAFASLRYGPALHELLHAWANFAVPTGNHGAHWGFSSANGQLGGFDISNLVELGDDRYTAGSFGTVANGGNGVPYSPIELYLAGLLPSQEVPDLWVAEDGNWLVENGSRVRSEDGDVIFTGSDVKSYTISDLISQNGERDPPMVERTDQRAAVVLLINDYKRPSEDVLETLSEDATWLARQGDDGSRLYNYYEATGGRATLSLDGLSAFLKATPSAPANLPASFGEAPPPHATGLDGACGPLESISGHGSASPVRAGHDDHRLFSGLPGHQKYKDGREITLDEFSE